MADIILVTSASIITLVLFIRVLVIAYYVWNNRPVNIQLIPIDKPVGDIDLGPYVDIIINQFPEVLDD
jgi:hypothetical protein